MQLYEALLEGALLFAILFVMSRKRPPFARGTYFGVFMVGYGICRFLIEFVRQPVLSSVTFGAAGSPWGRCFRCRLLWRA